MRRNEMKLTHWPGVVISREYKQSHSRQFRLWFFIFSLLSHAIINIRVNLWSVKDTQAQQWGIMEMLSDDVSIAEKLV